MWQGYQVMKMDKKRILEYLDVMEERSMDNQNDLNEFDQTNYEEIGIQDAITELRHFITRGEK